MVEIDYIKTIGNQCNLCYSFTTFTTLIIRHAYGTYPRQVRFSSSYIFGEICGDLENLSIDKLTVEQI